MNRESLELAQRVGNPLFEALAHYDRARVLQARGEVLRALDEVRQGLQRLQGLPAQRLYAARARLTLYEGYLLNLRLQPEQARQRLLAGLHEARACRDISVLIGYCVIASQEGSQGDFAKAFAELAEAERLMHIWDVPPIYYLAMITLVKCELWLAQGRIDLAEAWLARLGQTYNGGQPAAAPEFQPQLHDALPISCQRLDQLVAQGQASGGQLLCIQAWNQRVMLALAERQESLARSLFARAVEAGRGGALLPFQALLLNHPDWMREQLLSGPDTLLRQSLLERLPVQTVRGPVEPLPPTEQLSIRELAVLHLIAQGCSNQEISDQLFISLHTVKTHASHINSKLGVERRTQAVARAQELGLLGEAR